HDESYLAPYRAGRARIEHDVETFRTLTLDNPDQQRRVPALKRLIEDRFAALDFSLNRAQSNAPDLQAALSQGKQKMDSLRAEIDHAISEEQKLLTGRVAARRAAEDAEISA